MVEKLRRYPLVSIITVNYNQAEVTCALLESLNKTTYPNLEVIVVDNHSTEDDPAIIKQRFPNIVFIQNPINYGFAAGNNYGLMRARGEYIMLLNNDIEVPPGFLEPLVAKLENHPEIGAVSPRIKFYYQPDTIQYAGYTPIDRITMRNTAIGYREKDRGQYNEDRETAYAHGAAMMVPMRVVKEIGLMSYIFFLYYEEADWCERILRAGYKIYYVGSTYVLHKESVSTGRLSALKIYYLNRNRIVFMRRNLQGKTYFKALLYQLFVAIPKNAFSYLVKGKIRLFLAYYRAIGWHITHLFSKEIHENPML
ncbi:glycosyltransferase family 2 protein [Candidatus Sulfidibacterium hydrothermale]|uniref:glycosyltransferase family 2 protein n=1 Tax=Candidatus Sulfidibacterium hydrothermale TaxID=2875962 RepID=UPI001F0AD62B|nr:glycosyltransferase family 2 protein [Candidatus Sulfidibacterium hydrothermale]UBM63579.1 glycosyltransferase family 2 protein [Candidatus Sulfidibacterium hydrothermale]